MRAIASTITSVSLLALVVGGIAHIMGLKELSARAFQLGVGLLALVFALPMLGMLLERVTSQVRDALPGTGNAPRTHASLLVLPAVGGHLVLGAALLRRRFTKGEPAHTDEQVRRRERVRLPPEDVS